MPLTDARALEPTLQIHEADHAADLAFLARLADWCGHYSPWTAPDITGEAGENGFCIWLDITGCDHLFGGEYDMLSSVVARLNDFGFMARAAVADTPGTAWAAVHYGLSQGETILVTKPGKVRDTLRQLPAAALRFSAEICSGLDRLGLRYAGDLFDLPRGPLVARFGDILIRRVDQALGLQSEPISPQGPVARHRARMSFADPVGKREDVAEACRQLLRTLSQQLERAGRGVRRLEAVCYRIDGSLARISIGTSRATRNVPHLLRLLSKHFDSIDAGFGIETVVLGALRTDQLFADQLSLSEAPQRIFNRSHTATESMAALVDRVSNRIGHGSVHRLSPKNSYVPERATQRLPYAEHTHVKPGNPLERWFTNRPRPLSLFDMPQPIDVVAPIPDDPPVLFRWRRVVHRIVASGGAERVGPEWWGTSGSGRKGDSQPRDYYQVEDADGDRFWLYRSSLYQAGSPSAPAPRWYLHGLFS
jgi:protein ImuB